MFKRIFLQGIMILWVTAALAAGSYTDLMKLNNANQEKIKTFIATGQTTIVMRSGDSAPLVNQVVNINIFMKKPDLFKVTMQEPVAGVFVQKGNLLTQKMGNTPASTRKVEAGANLAKNYFGGIAIEQISESTISAQETAVLDGENVTVFTMKIDFAYEGTTGLGTKEPLKIEKIRVFINKNGMIVKQVMYHADKALLQVNYHYTAKDDIFIADKIVTKITYNTMDMETTIGYDSISLNVPVADKEFDLR